MYFVCGGKLVAGRTVGRIEMIVPVCGDIVRVAGETIRLLSWSYMTAREDTKTVSGILES
jgi:hypothetical protein